MKKSKPYSSLLVIVLFLILINLSACSAPVETQAAVTPTAIPPTDQPKATPGNQNQRRFTIGFSSASNNSDYMIQMALDLINVNEEYKEQALTNDLILLNTDTDTPGQISQIQKLIDQKVDAILVFPSDAQGLNSVLQTAVNKGILVFTVGVPLDLPGVYYVGLDRQFIADTYVKWLADKTSGVGSLVEIMPNSSNLQNTFILAAFQQSLAKNAGLKMLAQESGPADFEQSKQIMNRLLGKFPQMNGVLAHEGMAAGALQALIQAKPANFPWITGDGSCQFLKAWSDYLNTDPNFESIAVTNPPGATAPTALRIAVNMLEGKRIDPNQLGGKNSASLFIPDSQTITKENFEQEYFLQCMGKASNYISDSILTDIQVQQFFQK